MRAIFEYQYYPRFLGPFYRLTKLFCYQFDHRIIFKYFLSFRSKYPDFIGIKTSHNRIHLSKAFRRELFTEMPERVYRLENAQEIGVPVKSEIAVPADFTFYSSLGDRGHLRRPHSYAHRAVYLDCINLQSACGKTRFLLVVSRTVDEALCPEAPPTCRKRITEAVLFITVRQFAAVAQCTR